VAMVAERRGMATLAATVDFGMGYFFLETA
jgi:hypothetical protein